MTLDEARRALLDTAVLGAAGQMALTAETMRAFRVFWASRPSEEEFSATVQGIVLLPEMLYQMVQPR